MKELATALAKAQGKIKAALKDSQNPHFKSRYADLTSIWEACRAPLSENGLSVIQRTDFDGNDVWLVTMLVHASGESVEGRYPLRPQQVTPQGYGSAMTYARRYALAAMVGVVSDEDDDGNVASARQTPQATNGEAQPKMTPEAFANASITIIRECRTRRELDEWLVTQKTKLDALEDKAPAQRNRVQDAIDEKFAGL